MRFYRRRLPHQDIPGVPVFVTWCLHESLSPERVFRREHLGSGEAFAAWDRLLHDTRDGARYLAQPAIAELVAQRLVEIGQRRLCVLDSFVIMPNHVHLLCTPGVSLAELMQAVKGPTALQANRLLGLAGRKFWQEEYFDRMVLTEQETRRIRGYIELNPVEAGLCVAAELYPWSSANARWAGLKPHAG